MSVMSIHLCDVMVDLGEVWRYESVSNIHTSYSGCKKIAQGKMTEQ